MACKQDKPANDPLGKERKGKEGNTESWWPLSFISVVGRKYSDEMHFKGERAHWPHSFRLKSVTVGRQGQGKSDTQLLACFQLSLLGCPRPPA